VALTQSTEKRSETINRILEAAMNVFSEVGFGSTRVDKIAKRAGVNKATIYYHIGNKETLYARVIHSVIGSIADAIAVGMQEARSPEERMRTYVRNIVRAIDNNPQMPPLMMREVASRGKNLPEVVAKDFIRIIGIVTAILDEGVERGIFIETDPFVLHMMVIGTVMFYKASVPIRARLDQIPERLKRLNTKTAEEISRDIEELILRAIKR
jgi:TetR/AcrR family transcriptional regulator